MMKNLKITRIILIVMLTLLLTLSLPHMSFGSEEVVKPYNAQWVLVRKDAFDFYINEINTLQTKYDRAMEARESERQNWLMERSMLKEVLDLANEKNIVQEREIFRLNNAISGLVRVSKMKDVVLITSILANLIQASK